MALPPGLKPGTFGLSHGSGFLGWVIRRNTESWAGHAFVYIGSHNFGTYLAPDLAPAVVEATWPRTRISRASRHPDARWAVHEPLTARQRGLIVGRALELVGDRYDLPAYVGFALELAHAAAAKDMMPLMARDSWRVCSAVVADTRSAAGLRYWPDAPVNMCSPADLDNLAEQKGWFGP